MNRSARLGLSVSALVGTILLLATHSSLATSPDDWPVKFHPHLKLESAYDDNIDISPDHERADFSFTESPGLQLVYGDITQTSLSLDYTAGIQQFLQHNSQGADNHYVTFKGVSNFSHLKLAANNEFSIETSPNVEVGTRTREQQDLTDLSAEYLLNKYFSFGLLYHQELHHFLTSGQIDYNLFQPGVALYHHLSPKTDVYGEFDYGLVDEATGQDQEYQSASLGLRGKITSKITGRIGVGYENRDYSGSTPSVESLVSTVSLHGDFTQHTSADLVVERRVNPSVTVSSDSYTATRVDLTINQKLFHERFLAYIGGSYENDDYNQPISLAPKVNRTDDIWQGRIGLTYIASKRLEMGVSYLHQDDGSTVDTFSFRRNVVTVHALLHF